MAGYLMAQTGAVPRLGDQIVVTLPAIGSGEGETATFEISVTELDGRRAAWLHVRRVPGAAEEV